MMQSFNMKCAIAVVIVRSDWSRVISKNEFFEACVSCEDDEIIIIWLKIETDAERLS